MTENQVQENEAKIVTDEQQNEEGTENKITPWRCFSGSAISAGLAFFAYLLTKSVILTYTDMPIKFNNPMAQSIASTVRTLVMGITIMATFLFIMVTIGLLALGIKLIFTGEE